MGVFSSTLKFPLVGHVLKKRNLVCAPELQSELFGLTFVNPIGLAAGFDKDARWYGELAALGFGHIEVGTITGKPQSGNEKPRLFRLTADEALINRMGFNNQGADLAARRLARSGRRHPRIVLGVNLGKSKVVPVETATEDYLFSFERLFDYGDYFTINVSSPNTPGLRTLQNREPLVELLTAIDKLNHQLAEDHDVKRKPVLLKIAPDLTSEQLEDIVSIVATNPVDGIIATNTTISREGLKTNATRVAEIGAGGLSGAPLRLRSRQVVSLLYQQLQGKIPIIGVGGIFTGEDAWQMILSGASMLQIYTGFVYGGPAIVRDINKYLLVKLRQHGLAKIEMAVGEKEKFG
jgi:dihydroorotate dehydrogenase